jgi:hypothetical protein
MKHIILSMVGLLLLGGSVGAHAQVINPGNGCVIPKVDGERVPFPLRKANTKFELAENETYLLNGTIVSRGGRSFFRVDFNSQPWLATERMLQNPFFPVDDSAIQVGQHNGRLVQLAVVAHMNDQVSQIEGSTPLKLVPILPATPFSY